MAFWTRKPAWPGTQIVYQPGGVPGPGVATTEADLAELLSETFSAIYGGGVLVLDGQFTTGQLTFTAPLLLRSTFDVRLASVRSVLLDLDSGANFFDNPRAVIESDLQCLFTRINGNASNFVRTDAGNTNLQFRLKNLIYDPVTFDDLNVGPMVRSDNGATRWWFEDCALNPNLTAATRPEERLLQVTSVAPTSLEIAWYGPNAGRIQTVGSGFMQTALTGWDTDFTYGTFGGSVIDLAAISWAAATPTVVNRQP